MNRTDAAGLHTETAVAARILCQALSALHELAAEHGTTIDKLTGRDVIDSFVSEKRRFERCA